jgi:opacity protein-like surface antigen
MTRTKFARKTWRTPNPNRVGPASHSTADGRHLVAEITSVLVVLSWTAACMAASGPALGVKVGAQTIEDPVNLDKTTHPRLDLEVSSPLLWDEHADFALTFGGSSLGSHTETYTDTVDGTFIDDLYTDKLWLLDVRLAARLYPLGNSSRIRPYVGAGVGYYWFRDDWHNEYSDTFEDPHSPGTLLTVVHEAEGTETLASGFFPFVLAGLTVPVGSNIELTAEFQYDFGKEDSGYNLGGPIYLFGARFRF